MKTGNSDKALVVVDNSYLTYYSLFGAFSEWVKTEPDAKCIKPAKETDQSHLPDVLVYDSFRRILSSFVQKRFHTIDWVVTNKHQAEIDNLMGIDMIFTVDDKLSNNFRKKRCPFYKEQRKVQPKQFDVYKVKDYIFNVLYPQLGIDKEYTFVKVDGCESDDIIATIMSEMNDYALKVLISSDHDFLQLDGNVHQYDLSGKEIKRIVNGTDEELSAKDFLLWKIVRGDVSDNIHSVFDRYGDIKSYKLVKDRDLLKKMLKEDQNAVKRFEENKFLIDFKNIPAELHDKILEETKSALAKSSPQQIGIDTSSMMDLNAL